MRYLLLAGALAGCTSSARPPAATNMPDRFEVNLDVLVRSVTHPCGADEDNDGDGTVDLHWRYTYDSQGRSKRDQAKDSTGAVAHQIDYTWDNAGNLTEEVELLPGFSFDKIEVKTTYDSLGRRAQFLDILYQGDTVLRRETIAYSGYDEVGTPTLGAETYEDLAANTTQTMTRAYGYDGLGRRISLDVHFANGDLYQAWKHAYDDVALTVTTNLDEPTTLRGAVGVTDHAVDSYDADFHFVGTHEVSTSLADSTTTTIDTTNTWDGDRQLDSRTTIVAPPSIDTADTFTYKYSCDSGRESATTAPVRAALHRVTPRLSQIVP